MEYDQVIKRKDVLIHATLSRTGKTTPLKLKWDKSCFQRGEDDCEREYKNLLG